MFMLSEEDALAIHAAHQERGELAAAVELRRRFLGITRNDEALRVVRLIAARLEVTDASASDGRGLPKQGRPA